jgi:hypothetical protein
VCEAPLSVVFPSQQTGTTDNIPISPMSSQSNHFASKIVRVVHRTGYIIRVLRPSWLQVNLEIIQVAGTHCENQITVRWAPFSSRPGSDLGLLRGPSKREERASGIPQREIGPLITGKKFGGLQGCLIGEILDFRLASTSVFSIFSYRVTESCRLVATRQVRHAATNALIQKVDILYSK